MKLHRGRLIDHVEIVVADLDASRKFYAAVLDAVGVPIDYDQDGFFSADDFVVAAADSDAALGKTNGPVHVAFQAKDRAAVDAFHAAGLAAGGTDNGAPGIREKYHPNYYAAFLFDPDGNNIEAVNHGPAKRSAASVEIEAEMPG